MGLAEKRAIKEFQDGKFPEFTKSVNDALGFEVPIEVNWEQVTEDGMTHLINDSMANIYFQPVIDAVQSICSDEMGKEALQSVLTKVVFCNSSGHYSPRDAIKFEGGVLTIDHAPYSNIDDVKDRKDYLTEVLEKSL